MRPGRSYRALRLCWRTVGGGGGDVVTVIKKFVGWLSDVMMVINLKG